MTPKMLRISLHRCHKGNNNKCLSSNFSWWRWWWRWRCWCWWSSINLFLYIPFLKNISPWLTTFFSLVLFQFFVGWGFRVQFPGTVKGNKVHAFSVVMPCHCLDNVGAIKEKLTRSFPSIVCYGWVVLVEWWMIKRENNSKITWYIHFNPIRVFYCNSMQLVTSRRSK